MLYGLQDNKVSKEGIDLIFKNLKGQKQLKLYPNAGHENMVELNKDEWKNEIIRFINE